MPASLGSAFAKLRSKSRLDAPLKECIICESEVSLPLTESTFESSFESSPESQESQESHDATTISSGTSFGGMSPGHKSRYASKVPYLSTMPKDEAHADFSRLQQEFQKFSSRHGAARANVLRLSLLPFLRERRHLVLPSSYLLAFRTSILESWWSKLLADVLLAAGSDRNAYYEAISDLISRPEWLVTPRRFEYLLGLTVEHVLERCAQPNLPIAMGAFVGKTLAYAFFHVPRLGEYLLSKLDCSKSTLERFVAQLKLEESTLSLAYAHQALPGPVQPLIGIVSMPHDVEPPDCISSELQGWERYWNADSSLFSAFLKHYFGVLANLLPPPPLPAVRSAAPDDDQLEVAVVAPGVIPLLASVVTYLDRLVVQSNRSLVSRPTAKIGNAGKVFGQPTGPIRVDQLRLFSCLREILHNDGRCVAYYQYFGILFDRMFEAVASGVQVYNMDACVTLCDLAEEWICSITLNNHELSMRQVSNTRHLAVDWDFWLEVAKLMLSSSNSHSEVRALAFLANIWPYFPPANARAAAGWVLDPVIWCQLFLHWSPLVRSYYHRLLSYRVLTVDRPLLTARLAATYNECVRLAKVTRFPPASAPSLPLAKCCIAIVPNAASGASAAQAPSLRAFPFDIFDNAVYWTSPEPAGSGPEIQRRASCSSVTSGDSTVSSASAGSKVSESSADSTFSSDSSGSMRRWWNRIVVESAVPPTDKKKKSKKKQITAPRIPPPPELMQPRPEICRSKYRFVLLPAHNQPRVDGKISRPRLPLDPERKCWIPESVEGDAALTIEPNSTLALWNYGSRSLAEWNITVDLCEVYLQQHKHGMPFVVAEIPWKAVAQSQQVDQCLFLS